MCRSKLLDLYEQAIESQLREDALRNVIKEKEPMIETCLDKLHPLKQSYCVSQRKPNSFWLEVIEAPFHFARKCDCDHLQWMIDSYEELRKEIEQNNAQNLHSKETEQKDSSKIS